MLPPDAIIRERAAAVRRGDLCEGVPFMDTPPRRMLLPFAHQSTRAIESALKRSREHDRMVVCVREDQVLAEDALDRFPEYRKLLAEDACLRVAEVARIADPRALAWVAVSDPDVEVALRAVEGIDDSSVCIAIATAAPNWRVRRAAVGKVWDVEIMRAIAVSDPDPLVRVYALEAMGDPAFAAERARQDSAAFVRLNAVQIVDDRQVLMTIAREDADECVRSSAGYCAWLLNPSTLDAAPAPGM